MSDTEEIGKRIERLLKRVGKRDTYRELLASGTVTADVGKIDDADLCRAEIRRQARNDKIRVRTGEVNGMVWAMLVEAGNEARRSEGRRYWHTLGVVVNRAVAHRHEPDVAIRDGDEAVFTCRRCEALGYADGSDGGLVGGSLPGVDCPHDEPPGSTELTFFAGPAPDQGR